MDHKRKASTARIAHDEGVCPQCMRQGAAKVCVAPLSKAQLLGSRTASCALIGLIVFAVV